MFKGDARLSPAFTRCSPLWMTFTLQAFWGRLPLATLLTTDLGFRISKEGSISMLELMVAWHIDCVQWILCVYTVGSWLFEPRLSISGHSDIGSRRHVFGPSEKKTLAVTGVLLREKAKLLYKQFSQMLQHLFHAGWNLDHDLQHSS